MVNHVKWPHEYILSGVTKERVTYVGGWLWPHHEGGKKSEIKEHMFDIPPRGRKFRNKNQLGLNIIYSTRVFFIST